MREPDLVFLHGQAVARCTHDIDKHFEGYQTLQYMDGGAVELSVGARRFVLEGRWFWSAWPGPRVAFHAAAGHRTWSHRWVAFRGPRVGRWTAEGIFPVWPQASPGGGDYGPRFDELLRESRRGDRWGRRRAIHLLEGLLIELAEARAQASAGESWLGRVIESLDAARGDEVDYEALAEGVGMAESTLRRRFKRATGVPPHVYVVQARVAEARRLLGETTTPIKTIARELGYRDVYFFSRQFRRFVGVPPGVYRRSAQG